MFEMAHGTHALAVHRANKVTNFYCLLCHVVRFGKQGMAAIVIVLLVLKKAL
jgi:hypothetical protein